MVKKYSIIVIILLGLLLLGTVLIPRSGSFYTGSFSLYSSYKDWKLSGSFETLTGRIDIQTFLYTKDIDGLFKTDIKVNDNTGVVLLQYVPGGSGVISYSLKKIQSLVDILSGSLLSLSGNKVIIGKDFTLTFSLDHGVWKDIVLFSGQINANTLADSSSFLPAHLLHIPYYGQIHLFCSPFLIFMNHVCRVQSRIVFDTNLKKPFLIEGEGLIARDL